MTNAQAPFGFLQVGTTSGPPNFARAGSASPYRIKSSYTKALFFGDAVRLWGTNDSTTNGAAAGYLVQWVVADGAGETYNILAGIFIGCEYYSTSQKKTIWNNYWPGSDATGDVTAYVVDDPASQWMVQGGATALDYAAIGQNIDIAASPVGNTTTGQSGMSVVTVGATASLPFRILNVVTSPPGVPGRDITAGYNNVIVGFNNQINKALIGGV